MPEPLVFPAVPIVGQPFEILGWSLIIPVRCKCAQSGVVLLHVKQTQLGRSADVGICPSCAQAMHIQTVSMDAAGHMEFALAFGGAPPKK